MKEKIKKTFRGKKNGEKVEQYVLQEIRTFDFKLIKYFGGEKVCCKLLKKLQEKLKCI